MTNGKIIKRRDESHAEYMLRIAKEVAKRTRAIDKPIVDEIDIVDKKKKPKIKGKIGESAKDFIDKWKFCMYEPGKEPETIVNFDDDGNVTTSTLRGKEI